MIVLYDGEKVEYDVSRTMNYSQILSGIELRRKYLGQKYGDFEIVSVDYDWGLGRQVNVAKCVKCGFEKEVPDLGAFFRGKGVGGRCGCTPMGRVKEDKKVYVVVAESYEKYVGEKHGGFRIVDYQKHRSKGFRVECLECGKTKWATVNSALNERVKCDHKVKNDYSDSKYIGKKIGSLTAIAREGNKIRFRCDCGAESVRKPNEVFGDHGVKSCGRPECAYHKVAQYGGNDKRLRGLKFEFDCAKLMQEQGFAVEMTPGTGDYGVDFFAVVDGERVAFQCKRLKVESMVGAVQEVYAGGRYYDCCKFVVISPSGFTYNAEVLASKLGVQLERNCRNFRLKSLVENKIETQKIQTFSGGGLIWEIDGISKPAQQWCEEYGLSRSAVISRMKKGLSLKEALSEPKYGGRTMVEIDGVVKPKQEWCDEYGISPQLYDYRVKYSKLSPLEALTKPKA